MHENNVQKIDISIIGPAIMDVMAGPISLEKLKIGSQAMNNIQLSFGGDALNESVVLQRLGKRVNLISKVGDDDAGHQVLAFIKQNNIAIQSILLEEKVKTAINIALFDEQGERYFLTDPNSSLRNLAEHDIDIFLEDAANIISFASMFISPLLDIPTLERLFSKIKKKKNRILTVDLTKAKNGESLTDLKHVLPYVDVIFPNEEEIALLTGKTNPYDNAKLLLQAGVGCAVIKRGKKGCIVCTKEETYTIPAYAVDACVDSTGAGDCFVAGFLWGLSEGMELRECGRFANVVASFSVEHVGATNGITSLDAIKQRYKYFDESHQY